MKSIILACFVAVVAGCDSDPSGGQRPDVIMPLAVGNRWIYERTTFDPDSTINNITVDTIEITDVTENNGEVRYYTFLTNDAGLYYMNKPDSLWTGSLSIAGSQSHLSVPYPAEIGAYIDVDTMIQYKWDSLMKDHIYDTVITRLTLTNQNAAVAVKAGVYVCHRYEIKMTWSYSNAVRYYQDLYYAPNVGRVLLEMYAADTHGKLSRTSRSELLTPPRLY